MPRTLLRVVPISPPMANLGAQAIGALSAVSEMTDLAVLYESNTEVVIGFHWAAEEELDRADEQLARNDLRRTPLYEN